MKPATLLTTVLLLAIAILHVARLIGGVRVTVGDAVIPMWASVVAAMVPLGLALGVLREHRESGNAG